ncbi:MAG: pilus assembly protein [Eubacteriales bacterium]|nr:pilus assembly protein [Eubacteriales bacterium]
MYCFGSATVEAALVFPIFLCAICSLCVIGQFMMSESAIYHATAQTSRVYAKQQSVAQMKKGEHYTSKLAELGGIVEGNILLRGYLDEKDVSSSWIAGGKTGVIVAGKKDSHYATLESNYVMKVPVPFFQWILLPRKVTVRRRLFTGYFDKNSSGGGSGGQSVFVAKTGTVYHTHLDCYHIMITIKDQKQLSEIMTSSKYKKCKKCMANGSSPSAVYITQDGDCYHSSLECSGLKREISLVNKDDVSDMRICTECAKH